MCGPLQKRIQLIDKSVFLVIRIPGHCDKRILFPCLQCPARRIVRIKRDRIRAFLYHIQTFQKLTDGFWRFRDPRFVKYFLIIDQPVYICG